MDINTYRTVHRNVYTEFLFEKFVNIILVLSVEVEIKARSSVASGGNYTRTLTRRVIALVGSIVYHDRLKKFSRIKKGESLHGLEEKVILRGIVTVLC